MHLFRHIYHTYNNKSSADMVTSHFVGDWFYKDQKSSLGQSLKTVETHMIHAFEVRRLYWNVNAFEQLYFYNLFVLISSTSSCMYAFLSFDGFFIQFVTTRLNPALIWSISET